VLVPALVAPVVLAPLWSPVVLAPLWSPVVLVPALLLSVGVEDAWPASAVVAAVP
jgi:hypothetical protein